MNWPYKSVTWICLTQYRSTVKPVLRVYPIVESKSKWSLKAGGCFIKGQIVILGNNSEIKTIVS